MTHGQNAIWSVCSSESRNYDTWHLYPLGTNGHLGRWGKQPVALPPSPVLGRLCRAQSRMAAPWSFAQRCRNSRGGGLVVARSSTADAPGRYAGVGRELHSRAFDATRIDRAPLDAIRSGSNKFNSSAFGDWLESQRARTSRTSADCRRNLLGKADSEWHRYLRARRWISRRP
jgi:hypothetical protein